MRHDWCEVYAILRRDWPKCSRERRRWLQVCFDWSTLTDKTALFSRRREWGPAQRHQFWMNVMLDQYAKAVTAPISNLDFWLTTMFMPQTNPVFMFSTFLLLFLHPKLYQSDSVKCNITKLETWQHKLSKRVTTSFEVPVPVQVFRVQHACVSRRSCAPDWQGDRHKSSVGRSAARVPQPAVSKHGMCRHYGTRKVPKGTEIESQLNPALISNFVFSLFNLNHLRAQEKIWSPVFFPSSSQ